MRSASSYRGARRNAAKEKALDWDTFQREYWGNRAKALAGMEAKALDLTPAQAREFLAKWAAAGAKDVVSLTEIVPAKRGL